MNGFTPSTSTFCNNVVCACHRASEICVNNLLSAIQILLYVSNFCWRYDGRDMVVTKVEFLPFNSLHWASRTLAPLQSCCACVCFRAKKEIFEVQMSWVTQNFWTCKTFNRYVGQKPCPKLFASCNCITIVRLSSPRSLKPLTSPTTCVCETIRDTKWDALSQESNFIRGE